jgi:hypothetical protein
MNMWLELIQTVSVVEFTDEADSIIWQYESSGKFSVQSLCVVISNGGVRPVYTLVMWNISVPSRVYIFMWFLANNKTLTIEKGEN